MFHKILVQPFFNALVFLYGAINPNDLGIAIIVLTIVIRVILYPLFFKIYKNQTLLQKIQPTIKQIQHDHKNNREKQAQELLSLYKQHRVNPFSNFFLVLIQLPILIALFQVFRAGISPESLADLYNFVPRPEMVANTFLNLIDLTKPNIIMVGLSAIAQYFQSYIAIPKSAKDTKNLSPAEKVSRQMIFIGPVLTAVILYRLPAAIGIYWLTTSLFSLIQQIIINYSFTRKSDDNRGDSGKTKNTT